MVGVADQLGSVKTYLGQVLGVFSVLRLGRRIIAWLRGKNVKGVDGWANEWSSPSGIRGPNGQLVEQKRPSSKPLLLFLLSAVGLPWLMSRLVKLLIASQQRQQQELQQASGIGGDGNLDPSRMVFARGKWEFQASEQWELSLARDEIVAVLERRDEGADVGWWRGRTRDGRIGWFPGNYVRRRFLQLRCTTDESRWRSLNDERRLHDEVNESRRSGLKGLFSGPNHYQVTHSQARL